MAEKPIWPEDTITVVRPLHCRYCGNGYYALAYIKEKLETLSDWNIVDIAGENATKENIIQRITEDNPLVVISFGHGLSNLYTAENEEIVFTKDNIDIMRNRIWHTLSCLVGKKLGKDMIEAGGLIFSGYIEEWHWFVNPEHPEHVDGDPYEDKYAKGFFESDATIALTLAITLNPEEARKAGMKMYNSWIDHWFENQDNDPYASEAIKWLLWDRDAYVYYAAVIIPTARPSLMHVAVMSIPVVIGLALTYKPEISKSLNI